MRDRSYQCGSRAGVHQIELHVPLHRRCRTMLKSIPAAALLFLAAMQTSAYAAECEGQKGSVIFEDDFTDDTGGWADDPRVIANFGNSGFTLHIQEPWTNWYFSNLTFTATEGDFCVEAVMPKPAAGIG